MHENTKSFSRRKLLKGTEFKRFVHNLLTRKVQKKNPKAKENSAKKENKRRGTKFIVHCDVMHLFEMQAWRIVSKTEFVGQNANLLKPLYEKVAAWGLKTKANKAR